MFTLRNFRSSTFCASRSNLVEALFSQRLLHFIELIDFENFNCVFSAGIKKVQRVSDVNAMGYPLPAAAPEYVPNTFVPEPTYGPQSSASIPVQSPQQRNFNPNYNNPTAPTNYYDSYSNNKAQAFVPSTGYSSPQPTYGQAPIYDPNAAASTAPTNPGIGAAPFAMFNEPMVQDMALQYGQKLADHGKQLVESHFEKYVPVTRLKYYFAVDNNYVVKKLMLLFFPFTHRVRVDSSLPAWGTHDLFLLLSLDRTGHSNTIKTIPFSHGTTSMRPIYTYQRWHTSRS